MLQRFRSCRRPAAVLALVGALGCNACVAYVPAAAGATPAAGTRVRLDFAAPTDVRMGAVTANDVRILTGELVGADTATLTVAAMRAVSANGFETLGPGLSVVIPRREVREVRTSRISPSRSAGFFAVVAGVTLVVVGALSGAGGGEGPRGGGGGSPR